MEQKPVPEISKEQFTQAFLAQSKPLELAKQPVSRVYHQCCFNHHRPPRGRGHAQQKMNTLAQEISSTGPKSLHEANESLDQQTQNTGLTEPDFRGKSVSMKRDVDP